MSSEKFYPVDIPGVRLIGPQKWIDSFPPNIPCGEYQKLYASVFESFIEALPSRHIDPEIYYSAVSNYKVIPQITQHLYEIVSLKKIRENGYEYVDGKEPVKIEEILDVKKRKISIDTDIFELKGIDRLRERWRAVRTNFGRACMFCAFFPGMVNYRHYIIGDRSQKELIQYVHEATVHPVCLRPLLFFMGCSKYRLQESDRSKIESFSNSFFEKLSARCSLTDGLLDQSFKDQFLELLSNSLKALKTCQKRIKSWSIKEELLVTHIGNVHHRIFASAWNTLGGKVVGFSHGNIYPYAYVPGDILNGAFQIYDRFIVASEGEKRLLEYAQKDFKFGFRNNIEFATYKNSIYNPIFKEFQKADSVKEIKKVMYVGFPTDYNNYSYSAEINTMTYVSLEIRIMKDLKKAGYYIIYKAHPDTLSQTRDLYAPFCDEIITEKFENVWRKADCVFFGVPYSTTFGYTLMTNRPVVLMDLKTNYWHPSVYPLLKQRCAIVNMKLQDGGKLDYDSAEIAKAVEKSKNNISYELIKKFAL